MARSRTAKGKANQARFGRAARECFKEFSTGYYGQSPKGMGRCMREKLGGSKRGRRR